MPGAELERLWQHLRPLVVEKMPLAVPLPRSNRFGSPLVLSRVHWVRPEMVVEVTYTEWTARQQPPESISCTVCGKLSYGTTTLICSRCPIRRGSDPWYRLILPDLIHAARGLDPVTDTPPGDEGPCKGGIGKIDGRRIVEHASCT